MSDQLLFPIVSDDSAWYKWLAIIKDMCAYHGNKIVAGHLDLNDEADVTHCLREQKRMNFKLRHLPALLRLRLDDQLPALIAQHCDRELAQPRPLTAAERLERLEAALLRAGTAGAAILDDAYGRRR